MLAWDQAARRSYHKLIQANDLLAAAARIVQEYLDKQPDPEAHAVYLQQPHHQALWVAWQAKQEEME